MQIQIDKLIRSKRKTIAIIIERDETLTVRAPKRATLEAIEHFISEKMDWILRTREKVKAIITIPKKRYTHGDRFLFLGNEYELELVRPQRPHLKFERKFFLGISAQTRGEQLFTHWYKEQALHYFSGRVAHFAELHGFTPKQVKITSAKTRWGSCSLDGTLNFTWRLVLAPPQIIDYVVVHELTHLRVKNHSRKFWQELETIFPEYRKQRKWLRLNGESLNL